MTQSTALKADVTIVGGGLAGIVAAIELLDKGLSINLIDRDAHDKFGGLAKASFGGIFFVNSPLQQKMKIKDSIDQAKKDWYGFAEYDDNSEWPKIWANAYIENCTQEVCHWLTAKGIKFFPVVHWVERGLFQPGNSVPRFHMVWGTGYELTNRLVRHLEHHPNKANLNLYFHHKVEDLLTQNNKVKGVKGVIEQKEGIQSFEAHSDHTIIATGGISGSIEKVKAHWYGPWGAPPTKILNGSHQYADGTLHEAAEKVHANLTHLDNMWHYAAGVHHPNPDKPNHGLSIVPPKSALWVDHTGNRFGPLPLVSGYDTRFLVEQISQQNNPEEKYSWQIMNFKIAKKELAVSGAEFNDAIREKQPLKFILSVLLGNKKLVRLLSDQCVDFVTAQSVDELAEKMNALNGDNKVDVQMLKSAVEDYDKVIDRGKKYFNDDQLRRIAHLRQYRGDRLRTCKFQKINDRKALPLIAIREFILSRKSLGGIQTNLDSQVLTKPEAGNQPIPGLYAIGETAGFGGGGMHGHRSLEGTFLGGCIYTAKQAAKAIKAGK